VVIIPNNWAELQHYKDRSPPWIKLHKKLLDNYDFQCLPVASRALAPMLWLLASEHENGEIDAEPKKLAFRLRMTEQEAAEALQPLITTGFFSECKRAASKSQAGASKAQAKRSPETETETEREKKDGGRFAEFWAAWPKNDRKQDKGKCAELWSEKKLNAVADVVLADVQAKKATAKWRQGYIEAPLVYLRNRRWEDAQAPASGATDWFRTAGFENAYEANNAQCFAHNAHEFRNGKREVAA
jgi:hypothetical protein